MTQSQPKIPKKEIKKYIKKEQCKQHYLLVKGVTYPENKETQIVMQAIKKEKARISLERIFYNLGVLLGVLIMYITILSKSMFFCYFGIIFFLTCIVLKFTMFTYLKDLKKVLKLAKKNDWTIHKHQLFLKEQEKYNKKDG